jgi:catechol 2,3-dioxygenase-like lactoylglutathione lyase family enzyme
MPALLGAIGQISVRVHDLDRATRFYKDVLELPLLFSVPNLAFFDAFGVRLMLGRAEKSEFDHASSILYFQVADIEHVHATLAARGVRFEGVPHVVAPMGNRDLWMAFFYDSEENLLAMMSEVPRA